MIRSTLFVQSEESKILTLHNHPEDHRNHPEDLHNHLVDRHILEEDLGNCYHTFLVRSSGIGIVDCRIDRNWRELVELVLRLFVFKESKTGKDCG